MSSSFNKASVVEREVVIEVMLVIGLTELNVGYDSLIQVAILNHDGDYYSAKQSTKENICKDSYTCIQ